MDSRGSARRRAVWLAAAMVGVCWALFSVIPLLDAGADAQHAEGRRTDGPLGLAAWVAGRLWSAPWAQGFLARTLLVVVPFVLLLGVYGLLLRALARGGTLGLKPLLGLSVLACVPLVLTEFLLSPDVYSYIVYARMPGQYGGNPYVHLPMDFADPFTPYISRAWRYVASPYGPLWSLLTMGFAWVAERLGGSGAAYLMTFKLGVVAAHLGNVALVYLIARKLRPGQESLAAGAYAFNPLVLAESAWNAHNDSVMLVALLGAFAAHLSGRRPLALVLLVVSIFLKWVTVVVLPLYLLLLLRESGSVRRAAAWVGGAAAVVVLVGGLGFAPFWAGPDTLFEVRRQTLGHFMHNSLADLVQAQVRRSLSGGDPARDPDLDVNRTLEPMIARYERTGHMDWALAAPPETPRLHAVLRWWGRLALVGVWAWGAWRLWRRGTSVALLEATGWSFFTCLTLTITWFWPWYLTWLIGVACVAGNPRLFRASVLLSLCVWAIYFGQAGYLGGVGEHYRALFTFAPALLYVAASARASREAVDGAPVAVGLTPGS